MLSLTLNHSDCVVNGLHIKPTNFCFIKRAPQLTFYLTKNKLQIYYKNQLFLLEVVFVICFKNYTQAQCHIYNGYSTYTIRL